jgi:hypothetical protein
MLLHEPQEIEVWYVLPAIRKEIAKEIKNLGVSQVKISKLLGVTTAAVSQYLSGKRAKSFEFPDYIQKKIKNASVRIEKDQTSLSDEMQKIIHEIRVSGLLCKYHKKHSITAKGCAICVV